MEPKYWTRFIEVIVHPLLIIWEYDWIDSELFNLLFWIKYSLGKHHPALVHSGEVLESFWVVPET